VSAPFTVMVTGVSTPIGERLVRELLADSRVGHVMGLTDTPVDRMPLRPSPRLSLHQVDLSRERHTHRLLFGEGRKRELRVVVHTAMHRSAWAEGEKVRELNVEGTRILLSLCERHPSIRRLVVRSAAEVYSVQRDLPVLIGEDHPLNMLPNAPSGCATGSRPT
jgi:UDP-glucose 4-epimerase